MPSYAFYLSCNFFNCSLPSLSVFLLKSCYAGVVAFFLLTKLILNHCKAKGVFNNHIQPSLLLYFVVMWKKSRLVFKPIKPHWQSSIILFIAFQMLHMLYTTSFYTPTSHCPVCFAGTGGESIYGSKFPGENAKLWSIAFIIYSINLELSCLCI